MARTNEPRRPQATGAVPHDLDAEESLLAAILIAPRAVQLFGELRRDIVPEDFYKPTHQHVWAAMVSLHEHGDPIEPAAVIERLRKLGTLDMVGGPEEIMRLLVSPYAVVGSIPRYVRTICDVAGRRQLIQVAAEINAYGFDEAATWDAREALELSRAALARVTPGRTVPPADLVSIESFIAEVAANPRPYVIPGILRAMERAMIVAGEGAGKGVLLRQIAICLSQGIHPFDVNSQVPPVKTLYIDGENPPEAIRLHTQLTRGPIENVWGAEWNENMAWLLPRENGMDLRSRAGQAELEAAVDHIRPALLIIGPVYKMFKPRSGESFGDAASAAVEFLDDLRKRYEFAVLLEAHASKGSNGARDLDPAGSQVWMAWPEFGLTLKPAGPKGNTRKSMTLGRFRGDRLPANWPKSLHRPDYPERNLPWTGAWDTGMSPGELANGSAGYSPREYTEGDPEPF